MLVSYALCDHTPDALREAPAFFRSFAHGRPLGMSDNFPLSSTLVAGSDRRVLDPAVAEYLLAARAPNTHRAYAFDLADFQAWGGAIPCSPDDVARYVAARIVKFKFATLSVLLFVQPAVAAPISVFCRFPLTGCRPSFRPSLPRFVKGANGW